MGRLVLDADVVIGLLDARDAHHGAATEALATRSRDQPLIAATTYVEILVGPDQAGRGEVVDRFLHDRQIEFVPADRPIARRAAALRGAHASLRLGDALALATALERDAELLTFDKRLMRIRDGIR